MASSRTDYTQEWLNAESTTKIAPNKESGHIEPDEGLATRLYLLSREGLQRLCRRRESNSWQSSWLATLGKLHLWGESLENGRFDKALDQSEDLRVTVLELLCGIGNMVMRGKI